MSNGCYVFILFTAIAGVMSSAGILVKYRQVRGIFPVLIAAAVVFATCLAVGASLINFVSVFFCAGAFLVAATVLEFICQIMNRVVQLID